jgi:FtsP/CotA-like multicopper oxidase with cupredoxin domain
LVAAGGALAACTDADPSVVGGGAFRGRVHEYWLQMENRPWDAAPHNYDRATGQPLAAGPAPYLPVDGDVLVVRRYSPGWAAPMDEPVNAWDLTEPDPAVTGGGFPGAVLRVRTGDRLIVHFRNRDERAGKSDTERTHSLHAHGARHEALHDGSYPLGAPDPEQGGARGDRVPPGGEFTYRWSCPHLGSAGAWLYHDAAQGGWRLGEGGFGVLQIHAPGEPEGDLPPQPARARVAGDQELAAMTFPALPPPPKRGDYLLVFHELPGVGLCINGRRGLGSAPALLSGSGTRMTIRAVNATAAPLSFYIAGHRWQRAGRWVDAELLAPAEGISLPILAGSLAEGGEPGEWLITGRSGAQVANASLAATGDGSMTIEMK